MAEMGNFDPPMILRSAAKTLLVLVLALPVAQIVLLWVRGLLNSMGGEFTRNTPEQFAAFLATDAAHWQKVIKQMGLQLD